MASTVRPGGATVRPASRDRADEDAGYGWVAFAGTMVAIVGMLNCVYGIGAISDSQFYAGDITFIISDLNTWGWIMLVVGVVQFCAAFAILGQISGARWLGVASAAGNAIVQLLVMPAAPFLALALFALDILIIYGLVAHGRRPAHA